MKVGVDIVHHEPALTIDRLRDLAGLAMDGVRLRYVPREPLPNPLEPSGIRHLGRRYANERLWRASLSQPYDVWSCAG